jgi:polyhydroxyalkanoate synthase
MMEFKRWKNLLTLGTRKPPTAQTPFDVAFQENKWRLLHYRAGPEGLKHQTPVLLVPSLINRHYVLDLMPGKSFVEFLVAQGYDTWIIDWGTPDDEDRYVTFDDVTDRWLGRAIRKVSDTVPHQKTHVLGYCMGGTLAAIHGAVHPERIASLVALAAPVRFHDQSMLSAWANTPGFDVGSMIDALGNVPWQLMQSAFHLLRPTLGLAKSVMLLDRAWNDEFLDGFLALETWGNDNVALPGEFYRTYIGELYQKDTLLGGNFSLSGQRVRLSNITFPTLAVTFEHDNIVPAESAAMLIDAIGSTVKERLHLPGGHVGAVVSKHAAKTLWPQLEAFFARFDAPVVAAPAVIEPVPAPRASPAKATKAPAKTPPWKKAPSAPRAPRGGRGRATAPRPTDAAP